MFPAAPQDITLVDGYWLQQPEPQASLLAVRPAAGHSSAQQAQVQLLHPQLPVSQQPQHSHAGQPAFWPAREAGAKGMHASAVQRIRTFMGNLQYKKEIESNTPRHDM